MHRADRGLHLGPRRFGRSLSPFRIALPELRLWCDPVVFAAPSASHPTPEIGANAGILERINLGPEWVRALEQSGGHATVLRRIKTASGGGDDRVEPLEESESRRAAIGKVERDVRARHGKTQKAGQD